MDRAAACPEHFSSVQWIVGGENSEGCCQQFLNLQHAATGAAHCKRMHSHAGWYVYSALLLELSAPIGRCTSGAWALNPRVLSC